MTTLESSFDQTGAGGQKTSGLAIASLICSLICCLPLTTIPAILLGIGAIVTIRSNPATKGMGLAISGLVLGLVFTAMQAILYPMAVEFGKQSYHLMAEGPNDAITTGMSGDLAGFKASFHGAGATASDGEAQAFLDTIRDRYGSVTSVRLDEQNIQQQFGSPVVTFPYIFTFSGHADLSGESEIVYSDPQRGGFTMKLGSITIIDSELGDLTYPTPPGQAPPGPPTQPPPSPDASTPPAGDQPSGNAPGSSGDGAAGDDG